MSDLPSRLRRGVVHDWEHDGLPQLLLGGATLIMLLGLLVPVLWRPGLDLSWYFTAPALIVWAVILLCYKPILLRLKSYLTFPRTGYSLPSVFRSQDTDPRPGVAQNYSITDTQAPAEPEPDLRQQRWSRSLSGLLGVFAFLNLFIPEALQPWFFPFWLLVVLLLTVRTSYGRIPLILFVSAIVSTVLYFVFRLPHKQNILLVTACFAAVLTLDGAFSLLLFLRRHPRAIE